MKRVVLVILILLINPFSLMENTTEALTAENVIGNPNIITQHGYLDGYNLFVMERRNLDNFTTIDMTLLIVDMNGNVLLNKSLGTDKVLANLSAEFVNSTTILYGDSEGAKLLNIYTNEVSTYNCSGHHDYELNKNNNTIFTLNAYLLEFEGQFYIFDKLEEFDIETGQKIWEVNTDSFISYEQRCPYEDLVGSYIDLTHANSIVYDDKDDTIYINCRNTNAFYKINHKTKELMWTLGEDGNFTLRDIDGNIKEVLFYHGHAAEKVSDDTFIYFDNDIHNQTDAINRSSRMIEIRIDEETMTANITWEYIASEDYFSIWWGDSDRLPNGNRLGTFGTTNHVDNYTIGARLVEVNSTGKIVWEMNFPKEDNVGHGIYRMERFSFSPYILTESDVSFNTSEYARIKWKVAYNFKNKYLQNGNYKIYFENKNIVSGETVFNKYWQPNFYNLNLGQLAEGNYNLTIVLEDENQHRSTEFVNISVCCDALETTESYGFLIKSSVLTIFTAVLICLKKRR